MKYLKFGKKINKNLKIKNLQAMFFFFFLFVCFCIANGKIHNSYWFESTLHSIHMAVKLNQQIWIKI